MKTLILDPGHGGKHIGAAGNGLLEKDVNIIIANKIRDKMFAGWVDLKIVMTRENDDTVTLNERCKIANNAKGDLLYSIHCNGFSDPAAHGYTSYIFDGSLLPSTLEIQKICHSEAMNYLKSYGIRDRGMLRENFQILRETRMSAVLTENLFITNPQNAELLKNDRFLDGLANAHAQGIAKSLKLQPKEPETDDRDKIIADLNRKLTDMQTEYAKLKARYDTNVAEHRELLADIKRAAGILNKHLIE